MSQTVKTQRQLIVSGSSEFTLSVSQLNTPTHVEPSGSIARALDGTLWSSLDGGNWQRLGTGTPDGSTLSLVTGTLTALPLSGTVNSAIVALSGTIDAKFKSNPFVLTGDLQVPGSITGSGDVSFSRNLNVSALGNFRANVLITGSLTGSGDVQFSRNMTTLALASVGGNLIVTGSITGSGGVLWGAGAIVDFGANRARNAADPVAAQDLVTLSYFNAHSGSGGGGGSSTAGSFQRITYIANGTEGSAFTVNLNNLTADASYSVFMENASTGTFSYAVPASLRTTASFRVLVTADPVSGQEFDFLVAPSNGISNVAALMTNVQRFSYFATGTEGSAFTVNLPSVQNDTLYTVFSTNASTASFVTNIPSGSRTTSSFQVLLTAAPAAGAELDFFVIPSTNAQVSALTGVAHDATLSGTGTSTAPLSVVGGAYRGAWTAGTLYAPGAIVSRNGYSFGANRATAEDPLFSEGDISSSLSWLLDSTTPISGGYAGAPDTYAVFVNNQTSKHGSAVSRSTGSDWNGRRIAYDAAINGGADAFSFGILDAAYPYTSVTGSNGLLGVPTAWGVYVDIFNQQIKSLVDGTGTVVAGYSKTDATTLGNFLDRWYVNYTLTGSNAVVEFMRDDASHLNSPRYLLQFTVVKPTYTNYRVAASAWSGGIAGTFYFRGATTRVSSSGDWTRLGPQQPLT